MWRLFLSSLCCRQSPRDHTDPRHLAGAWDPIILEISMTYITINQLEPEYAGMLFKYFTILNRHEVSPINHYDATNDVDDNSANHDELCLPTSTHVMDGDYEYELLYDIDDNSLAHKFIARISNFDTHQDVSPIIEVAEFDRNSFIGHTMGITEHEATHLVKFLVRQSIEISRPITGTYHKTLWN